MLYLMHNTATDQWEFTNAPDPSKWGEEMRGHVITHAFPSLDENDGEAIRAQVLDIEDAFNIAREWSDEKPMTESELSAALAGMRIGGLH